MTKLNQEQIQNKLEALGNNWKLNSDNHLQKSFSFDDFLSALSFANKAAPIAEEMQHHPDLLIKWGKCSVEIWSHDVGGLTQKDFELAQKIQALS